MMSEVKEVKYKLTLEQRNYFASVLLLEDMNNFSKSYPVLLEDDENLLEPLFVYMCAKKWVDVEDISYVVTSKGREVLRNYLEKLTEFRSVFKIYSAVDTGEGEFGYSDFHTFDTDAQFENHINHERFEDLRVAVCELKSLNPLDIIFLEFVDNGNFDFEEEGWEAELVTGLIWDDMLDVANTNIHLEDLTEYDDEGNVTHTGEDVMKIIMEEGSKLIINLVIEQTELDNQKEEYDDSDDDIIEEETIIEYIEEPIYDYLYYESYYDPYYVSPCWGYYY